jgi:2-iminobutanoate/2-iminopropanoate deaminase
MTMLALALLGTINMQCGKEPCMERIEAKGAPAAMGAYSQAIAVDLTKAEKLVFVAGQIAINPKTGECMESDIRTATRQTLDNIEAILKEAGSDWDHVARVDVFLRDMKDWEGMNEEYAKRFKKCRCYPARQTVGVSMDNIVEISCIAVVP